LSDAPVLILGGTFDPIHFGHLRPALEAMAAIDYPQLRLVPAARPPHRETPLASAEQRLAMARLAAESDQRIEVDDREFHRPGPSWTIDTLQSFREEWPQRPLALLIGEDSLHQFNTWKRWRDIPQLAHIVAMHRPGKDREIPEWAKARATSDREELKKQLAGRFFFAEVSPNPVSATTLRARLKNGEDISGMTPDSVIKYIQQHKLYQNS